MGSLQREGAGKQLLLLMATVMKLLVTQKAELQTLCHPQPAWLQLAPADKNITSNSRKKNSTKVRGQCRLVGTAVIWLCSTEMLFEAFPSPTGRKNPSTLRALNKAISPHTHPDGWKATWLQALRQIQAPSYCFSFLCNGVHRRVW